MTLPYIVIAGPTATGKTATAVALARLMGGEIISADSMQTYKYMNIGTAKATPEEMCGIPHYLIDELLPDEPYSVYEFKRRASAYADDIRRRGKFPIICGGTGFYINSLIKDTEFDDLPADTNYRDKLYSLAEEKGGDHLHSTLQRTDPAAAEAIHPNNLKRVIRALEYFHSTGRLISDHNQVQRQKPSLNGAKVFVLTMGRPLLYERINARIDRMIAHGLEDEVRGLLAMGYSPELTSMQGIGYKEMIGYIRGTHTLAEAVEHLKINTRRFSKRQLTWFSRQIEGVWLDVSCENNPQLIAEKIWEQISHVKKE